jgi:valyl-tRNA synthetase
LELIKPQIKDQETQVVMNKVLEKYLRIMHPFMPFITEEIWQKLQAQPAGSIVNQSWPHMQKQLLDNKAETQMQLCCDLIATLRNMRQEMEIPLQEHISAKIFVKEKKSAVEIERLAVYIKNMAKLKDLSIENDYKPRKGEYVTVFKQIHLVIPLSGIVDIQDQLRKCESKITKLEVEIENKKKTLENKNFTARAPKEIVEIEREKLKQMVEQLKKLEVIKNALR